MSRLSLRWVSSPLQNVAPADSGSSEFAEGFSSMETAVGAPTAVQRQRKGVDGKDDPKPGGLDPTSSGVRRSCDPCGRRKKKCDGEWPCGRCQRVLDSCTYSKRAWHLPDRQQQKNRHHHQRKPDLDGVRPAQVLQRSVSGAGAIPRHSCMLPFKRCRLSASPATGLVGMQENAFLSDFFGCMGFLPLATQSHIRETMVNIMLSPASRQQSAVGDDCAEVTHSDAIAMGGGTGNAFGGKELHRGPSACIFWCAVALGALVKGSPFESVASYSQLATEALAESYFGPADVGILKAWTILAYLYGFMGQEAKFKEYLAMSDNHFTASVERMSSDALPVGFAEMIENREKGRSSRAGMEIACSRDRERPQLRGGASEYELYRYVMQSFQALEKAIYAEVLKTQSAAVHEPCYRTELIYESTGDQPRENVLPHPHAISEAMTSIWIEGSIVQFYPLKDAADRPRIRQGIGGVLINGYLGFEAAGKGDVCGTLKRFGRCVEVFTRYPGLCRSIMGVHEVHMMLAGLAALDDGGAREMYGRLRAAYNPFRPPGTSPAPPLEEWQGMSSICGFLYCRAIEGVIKSDKMPAFSNPAGGGVDGNSIRGDESEEACPVAANNHNGPLAPTAVLAEEWSTTTPYFAGSNGPGSDVLYACETSGGLSRGGHGGTEQCLRYAPSGTTWTASAASPVLPGHCPSDTVVDEDHSARSDDDGVHVGNGNCGGAFTAFPETPLATKLATPLATPSGSSEGAEDMDNNGVGAADWLEVTHALLDECNEIGQASNRMDHDWWS